MPIFTGRSDKKEWMDDFSVAEKQLHRALKDLRMVNRWLGGYSSVLSAVRPQLVQHTHRPLRVLDVGTGIADIPEYLVKWADKKGQALEVVAVDANKATLQYARRSLNQRLRPHQAEQIHLQVADALALPFEENTFDICLASLFMHHLADHQAIQLLQTMDRVARYGLVVSDLHRSRIAYYGLKSMLGILPASAMVRHDGPLSVLRGFRYKELKSLADRADLQPYTIRWHWAFRWILSTLSV